MSLSMTHAPQFDQLVVDVWRLATASSSLEECVDRVAA
jgi:hypothetical protein